MLDFGAGIGNWGFTFASFGYNVDFADVKSPHCWIVHDLIDIMNMPSICWYLNADDMSDGRIDATLCDHKYDIILCIQVLEHANNPEELLSMFHAMLSDNGLLVLETFFDDVQGLAPYHYKENLNKGYNKPEYWKQVLVSKGFHPIMNWDQDEWRLLIKL